jgi:hypothetical protein
MTNVVPIRPAMNDPLLAVSLRRSTLADALGALRVLANDEAGTELGAYCRSAAEEIARVLIEADPDRANDYA